MYRSSTNVDGIAKRAILFPQGIWVRLTIDTPNGRFDPAPKLWASGSAIKGMDGSIWVVLYVRSGHTRSYSAGIDCQVLDPLDGRYRGERWMNMNERWKGWTVPAGWVREGPEHSESDAIPRSHPASSGRSFLHLVAIIHDDSGYRGSRCRARCMTSWP